MRHTTEYRKFAVDPIAKASRTACKPTPGQEGTCMVKTAPRCSNAAWSPVPSGEGADAETAVASVPCMQPQQHLKMTRGIGKRAGWASLMKQRHKVCEEVLAPSYALKVITCSPQFEHYGSTNSKAPN